MSRFWDAIKEQANGNPEKVAAAKKKKEEGVLCCPMCASEQLTSNKKGFGAGKALGGALLTGGVGLLAGFIGSGKIKITCLSCGYSWKVGK